MKTSDFNYDLPESLIAQTPLKNRTDSRLLVVNKNSGDYVHEQFKNLHRYLKKGDVMVLNDTAVIPARLIGEKTETGAVIEVLLLHQRADDEWECLVKKAKKVKVGTVLSFGEGALTMECTGVKEEGIRLFKMRYSGIFYELLDRLGETPLPPYIHEKLDDPDRYQTVYSEKKGSAAAPTAGLHFTRPYLESLRAMGVEIVHLTLHVGLGTFRPVSVEDVTSHIMHEEYYSVPARTAEAINRAKHENRRIVAVGTTSLRTLETVVDEGGTVHAGSGWSRLFIYPPYTFRAVDALLTNFHLPESTLLMLVSAFASKTIIMDAYDAAIRERYRFFSFGDAMFLTGDHEPNQ
ncbi:MAG: tRNA preQ1(34) S-adenosylmethionine ribosyltransferase-isomerase QueA [Bacillota bacterium]